MRGDEARKFWFRRRYTVHSHLRIYSILLSFPIMQFGKNSSPVAKLNVECIRAKRSRVLRICSSMSSRVWLGVPLRHCVQGPPGLTHAPTVNGSGCSVSVSGDVGDHGCLRFLDAGGQIRNSGRATPRGRMGKGKGEGAGRWYLFRD